MSRALYTGRLVWIALLSTVFSVLFMFGLLVNNVLDQTTRIVGELTAKGMRSKIGLGCRIAPKQWGMTTSDGSQLYAYDSKTLRSANPKAPPLPMSLVRQIRAGALRSRSHFPLLRGNGRILTKVSDHGPCSLLLVHWRTTPHTRLGQLLQLVLVFGVGMGLCLIFAYYGFVRPMLRRVESLAQIARNVGQKESLFQTANLRQDDLGVIEEGLELANARILTDRKKLAAKNRALSQHIADIAHDLRTPITSLQLALERLTQSYQGERHEELSIALADTVYLEHLTNNLSMATRLREGLLEEPQQPLDLRNVVERVAGRLRLLARDKQMSLEHASPDQPVCVKGFDTLYERMLSNLVHNAVRYGETGGHVVILLEATDARFTLQVMDDGPGVPPSEIPRLQNRLYRSTEARQRDSTGQGLGLAITQEICHILDLTLTFSPIEPRGLCVTLQGELQSQLSCLFCENSES